MGDNYGGVIVDYDFGYSELPVVDAGSAALSAFGMTVRHSGSIAAREARSRDFDDYAVGFVDGRTLILGRSFGLDQENDRELAAAVSKGRAVLAFWFNDAASSYMFSLYRDGELVRFRSRGPGMDSELGEPAAGEPTKDTHPHDHQLSLIKAFAGSALVAHDLPLEHFVQVTQASIPRFEEKPKNGEQRVIEVHCEDVVLTITVEELNEEQRLFADGNGYDVYVEGDGVSRVASGATPYAAFLNARERFVKASIARPLSCWPAILDGLRSLL